MKATIEDFKTGWYGISMALSPLEIDQLLDLLAKLKGGEIGHFHFRSDYSGTVGIADLEVSLRGDQDADNLTLVG